MVVISPLGWVRLFGEVNLPDTGWFAIGHNEITK